MMSTLIFFSILFTALALIPTGAHALELPNKMKLSRNDYLTVQKIYNGWNLVGWFEGIALILSFIVAYVVWDMPFARFWSIIAVIALVGMAVMFWFLTLPSNKQTQNWTELSDNWQDLRLQWEYSHLLRAGCALIALVALVIMGLNI